MVFALRRVWTGRAAPIGAVYVCVFGTVMVLVGLLALSGTVQWLTSLPLSGLRLAQLLAGAYLIVAVTGARRCFRNAATMPRVCACDSK